jgi:hypothetical protein
LLYEKAMDENDSVGRLFSKKGEVAPYTNLSLLCTLSP